MYTIHPITCGTLTSRKGALTYLTDEDEPVVFPVLSFLVTADHPDDDTVVLVDTGLKDADDEYFVEQGREVGPPGGGTAPLLDGLADHDLTPADVDHVVLTHLHHDHASNNDLFEGAEFLVQRSELAAARDPPPILSNTYPEDNTASVERRRPTLLDGGYRLYDGIELLPTPGHSAGSQSVVVRTASGPHALIADLAYTRHNLDPGVTSIVDATGRTIETTPLAGDYIPPGILVDLEACYDSIARLRERVGPDGVLIPGHDPEHADRYPKTG